MKKLRKNRRVLGFREKDGETIPITAKVRRHISKIVASAKGLNISPKIKQFYGAPSAKVGRRKLTKFDKEAEEAYAKLDKPLLERLKDKTPEELMEWIQRNPEKAEELQRKGIIDEKGILCVPDWHGLDKAAKPWSKTPDYRRHRRNMRRLAQEGEPEAVWRENLRKNTVAYAQMHEAERRARK